jgi:hypothetical protein
MTASLVKWSAITGAVGGIVGIGGLFGLDRLAAGVTAQRRAALGLGVSYGEQTAFGINYGRVVNPDQVLGGVNEALRDATKRYTLYGAGLTEGDLAGKDTAEVAAALISKLKALVDATPPQLLGQTLQARGLNQFISLEDALRLRNTSRGELAELGAGFFSDRGRLGLSAQSQLVWARFSKQLTLAGAGIENTFVKGLTPLIPGLTKLSASVEKAIETLLKAASQKHWLEAFGTALEKVATYMASPQFDKDIKTFIDDVGALADAIKKSLQALGILPADKGAKPGAGGAWTSFGSFFDSVRARLHDQGFTAIARPPGVPGGDRPVNNPGNLRPVGASTGYRQFSTLDAGVIALAKDIQFKERVRHLTTMRALISRFAPPGENDVESYIRDVSQRSGIGEGQALRPNDTGQLARLMAAMIRHESPKLAKRLPEKVIIEILNNTGGSAIVSSSGISK